MTYIITDTNNGVPIAEQPGTTGRLVKEDNSQINAADWIELVTTPDSGVALNVDASSTNVVVEQDKGQVLNNMQNGETHFQSDFPQGLDTLNKFHLIYNGTATLPGNVNDSRTGAAGEVFEVDFSDGSVPTLIDYSGPADTNQWTIQTQTPMKFYNAGNGFVVCNAKLVDVGDFLGNDLGVLVSRKNGVDTLVQQIEWNINSFLSDTPEPGNEAGISYHANRINSFVFQIPFKNSGNVKFGFIINDKIVFAHEFTKQNLSTTNISLVNNPLRIEGSKISGLGGVLRFGSFDQNSGYFFQLNSGNLIGPSLASRFYSLDSHSYGAISNDFYRTFSAGNKNVTRPVVGVTLPLVSIIPKLVFPIAASTVHNKYIVSLKEINVSGSSVNLNDAVFIEVIFNQSPTILTGAFFNSVDPNSSVVYDVIATAVNGLGTRIYENTIYPNKENKFTINMEKVLSNFVNKYSSTHFNVLGYVPVVDIAPTITVTAISLSGNPVAMSATIVWAEKA